MPQPVSMRARKGARMRTQQGHAHAAGPTRGAHSGETDTRLQYYTGTRVLEYPGARVSMLVLACPAFAHVLPPLVVSPNSGNWFHSKRHSTAELLYTEFAKGLICGRQSGASPPWLKRNRCDALSRA